MPSRIRKEEQWAKLVIQQALRRKVEHHDDNVSPSMCDLRIGPKERPEIAIECVAAVDEVITATWNAGPARGPFKIRTAGNWIAVLEQNADVRRVLEFIGPMLQMAEGRGLTEVHNDRFHDSPEALVYEQLQIIGVSQAFTWTSKGDGELTLTMVGIGGGVDTHGDSICPWVADFLTNQHPDVPAKLLKSGAKEKHAFIPVDFGGAPWFVESYLTGDFEVLPTASPQLPDGVDRVWIASIRASQGIRWNGEWRLFQARGEGIDSQVPR